jgi:hypothetical protein
MSKQLRQADAVSPGMGTASRKVKTAAASLPTITLSGPAAVDATVANTKAEW